VKAFVPDLEAKLRSFDINPKFFEEFRGLIEEGIRPSQALRTRLARAKKYRACLDSLLTELSQPVAHRFPPQPTQSEVLV